MELHRSKTKTVYIRPILIFLLWSVSFCTMIYSDTLAQNDSTKIRVIMLGAHPDDCDLNGGGTAALFVSMGFEVKFVSLTDGDAGHQSEKGPKLAARRLAEAKEAGKRLGVTYDVLNHGDGKLLAGIEIRLEVIREIREWNADIVIAPRPNDYHPDHRYTGILVQDAAYMVMVPDIAPETPAMRKNPLFLYFQDRFKKPNPFQPDIAIDINSVFDKKIDALDAHESQVYEWLPWIGHYADQVPKVKSDRKAWLSESRTVAITPAVRASLEKWYGIDRAALVKHAEAFQICEYGFQPTTDQIRQLFPMLPRNR